MITLFRTITAYVLSLGLTLITFGRVELNRSGTSTSDDDAEPERPAVTQPLEETEKE